MSNEVIAWFKDTKETYEKYSPSVNERLDAVERKTFVQELQKLFQTIDKKHITKVQVAEIK